MTMTLIETKTVGAGGASSIVFNSIPATYTDLIVVVSARTSSTIDSIGIKFNASTSGYSMRRLVGTGSSTFSDAPAQPYIYGGDYPGSGQTANTFGNFQIYIPNYAGSTNKSVSVEAVSENNATAAVAAISTGLWANTAAITDITLFRIDGASANFVQYSTASLYGVTNTISAAKATGGVITSTGGYVYHTFFGSGTFTPSVSLTADVLVIAGGGTGGAYTNGGGGGAGGVLYTAGQSVSTAQTVTVGAGGGIYSNGSNSSFGALTATGGGRGNYAGQTGGSGGSGGGGGGTNGLGGAGTSGQGFAGGRAYNSGGGGGGAGAIGTDGSPDAGNGGAGTNAYATWATATGTGVSGYFAGGGGGGSSGAGQGSGGSGGGGAGGASASGRANTGSGGGGQSTGTTPGNYGTGGSGIVIVRYAV